MPADAGHDAEDGLQLGRGRGAERVDVALRQAPCRGARGRRGRAWSSAPLAADRWTRDLDPESRLAQFVQRSLRLVSEEGYVGVVLVGKAFQDEAERGPGVVNAAEFVEDSAFHEQ